MGWARQAVLYVRSGRASWIERAADQGQRDDVGVQSMQTQAVPGWAALGCQVGCAGGALEPSREQGTAA